MKKISIISIIVAIFSFVIATPEIVPNCNYSQPNSSDEMWDVLFTFETSAASMPGTETDGVNIYTTTWNADIFSRYEMDGTYLEDFSIPGVSNIRDLTYDDEYFYGSPASMTIYIMDLTNEVLVDSISVICGGISGVRHIAFDPTLDGGNGGFWIGNYNELGAIDRQGNQIFSNISYIAESCYGSAYDPWSTIDSPCLWLMMQTGYGAEIYQFNIASQTLTGIVHDASDLPGFQGGAIGGGLASYINGAGYFVLLVNIQQEPNLVGSYEMAATCDPQAPGPPTDFTITSHPSGALEAQLDWINPSVNAIGEPLTELDEIRVYRNDLLIYTDTMPVIGELNTYTDYVPYNSIISYLIVCGNIFGMGIPVEAFEWIGEDVPAAVIDLVVYGIPPNFTGILNWANPITGLHGGAFNEPILGYHIERNDGCFFEVTGIHTQYIDDTITGAGYYSYSVQPYNSVGDGGIAETAMWPWPEMLIYEEFGSGVFPPDGWSGEGDNWQLSNTCYAGWEIPEADFNWSPSTVGTQRLISHSIDTSGMSFLYLEFSHFINPYSEPDYELRIQTTSDGQNWHTAFEIEFVPDLSIQEDVIINTIDVGSENFQVAWVFDGDSSTINDWYLDDILLTEYYLGVTGSEEGYVTLVGGNGNVEDVEITVENLTVNPNETGYYFMILPIGSRNITASLFSYDPVTIEDVLIETGTTTSGIDFYLNYVGSEVINNPTQITGITSIYPNPFNPTTTISFSIDQNKKYELSIFNVKGQKVITFTDHHISQSQNHQITWDGSDQTGKLVSSGIYFCRLKSGKVVDTKRMLLLK